MSVKLLTEHHLEVLSLKGGCTGTSECTLVKMPHCWKSHVTAHVSAQLRYQTNQSFLYHGYIMKQVTKKDPHQPFELGTLSCSLKIVGFALSWLIN